MPVDAASLADLVREASRALRRRTAALAEPHGLTAHQLRAVRLISAGSGEQPMRLSDLAGRMGIVARSVTDVVDDLEKKGFASRTPHPTDRRSTVVGLTKRGERVLVNVERERASDAEQFFGVLDPAERDQLASLLTRLRSSDGRGH